jgi:diphosphomevalonate decarboxylase
MKWFAQAPANIALIKYMGKTDPTQNIPTNPSLSYTLNDLLSFCEIESHSGHEDIWEPLDIPGVTGFDISQAAQARFLKHLQFLKGEFGYQGGLTVRSCNNFPMSSGLASSASSFAALTKCACIAFSEVNSLPQPDEQQMAILSRQGSGSSCRSFFSPWALWVDKKVDAISMPYPELIHHAVIVSHEEKHVPSSEAHQRVTTSPLFKDRPARARENLHTLQQCLTDDDWRGAYEVVWKEFWDMHQLFQTSAEPFQYINDDVNAVLKTCQQVWDEHNDGPLVTMDAGPNIHLLFRPDQQRLADTMKRGFVINHDVI